MNVAKHYVRELKIRLQLVIKVENCVDEDDDKGQYIRVVCR